MTIRIFGDADPSGEVLTATVCIVGAGIAGLIAGTRIARNKRLRVIVLESGLKRVDPAIAALNDVDSLSDSYNGAWAARSRALGGTSLLWAGKLLPLSEHDTKPRPYLGLPGWPFDISELEPYRQEIEAFMGVDDDSHEESASDRFDPDAYLLRNDPDFRIRWPKRPTRKRHNLAYVFRREIARLDNLDIWLDATASGFDFDTASGTVSALTITNRARRSVKVVAQQYLIAAGTFETTRLLLLADRGLDDAISRSSDALGRYFNDHHGIDAAVLRPFDHALTNRALSDRVVRSSMRHLHFELQPAIQRESAVGSAYFDIGVQLPDTSALVKARDFMDGLRRAKLNLDHRGLHAILKDSLSLFRTAQWQWMKGQKYWPGNADLSLKIWVEQLPCRQNRISLSDRADFLEVPLLKLALKKSDAEERLFRVMIEKIDHYWKLRLGRFCRLDWKQEFLDPDRRIIDLSLDQAHPAGTTRMGSDPSNSVVDCRLKVHKIANLSVASASVFPTSGSANPTFTIMQLAMRATDALISRL